MPDLVLIAIITTIGGAIGGLVVAIIKPLMEDRIARLAEGRAADREWVATRRTRVERVGALLAMAAPEGDFTSTAEASYRELSTVAAAVADAALSAHVGRMFAATRGGSEWNDAHGDARHRAGELLSQL